MLERETVRRLRSSRRRKLLCEVADGLLEIGIVAREGERGAIKLQRIGQIPTLVMDVGDSADRGQILWRGFQHHAELDLGLVELTELDERTAQRDSRREVAGMKGQAGAARIHRFLMQARPPVFFGKLRKRNRRRVLLDPASKVFNAWIVRHRTPSLPHVKASREINVYAILIVLVVDPLFPASSVTVKVTK